MISLSAHPLQTVTLALWLSVGGATVVGMVVREGADGYEMSLGGVDPMIPEGMVVAEPFVGSGDQDLDTEAEPMDFQAPGLPPALPEFAMSEPLPEVPDVRPWVRSRQSEVGSSQQAVESRPTATADGGSTTARPETIGASRRSAGESESSASAMASRMAAGTMPAPRYPREARRRGQSGTVVVEFTVGASGRVVAASLKEPSRWPLLNREALRAVRGWKFPSGDVMTMQRPIVFQLR